MGTYAQAPTEGLDPHPRRRKDGGHPAQGGRITEGIHRNEGNQATRQIVPDFIYDRRLKVKPAGQLIGIDRKTHDLGRHCATFTSRSWRPIEIVRKAILRHTDPSITQKYFVKSSDSGALI